MSIPQPQTNVQRFARKPELVRFTVQEFPDLYLVGKCITLNIYHLNMINPLEVFWHQNFGEGLFEYLENAFAEVLYNNAYIGFTKGINDQEYVYVCGMLVREDLEIPADLVKFQIPGGLVAISWVQGNNFDLFTVAQKLSETAMTEAGYEFDYTRAFEMEVYTLERYWQADNQDGTRIIDYYNPVIVRQFDDEAGQKVFPDE